MPDVIRTVGTIAGDRLDTDVALVTVQQLLGHATVPTIILDDRRRAWVQKHAIGTVQVPY